MISSNGDNDDDNDSNGSNELGLLYNDDNDSIDDIVDVIEDDDVKQLREQFSIPRAITLKFDYYTRLIDTTPKELKLALVKVIITITTNIIINIINNITTSIIINIINNITTSIIINIINIITRNITAYGQSMSIMLQEF